MTNLIPTNGIHISESQFPKGFYVAKYDCEGFASQPRWFASIEKARAYVKQIEKR